MSDDYFAQRKAQLDREQQQALAQQQARQQAAMQRDKENKEHLRDVIVPFFEDKKKILQENGAFLRIEKDQVREGQLHSRLQLTISHNESPHSKHGIPLLIVVSPSLSVYEIYPKSQYQQATTRDVEIGSRDPQDLDEEKLEELYRKMVDQYLKPF